MECEVLYRTCDNCGKRKIVYPKLGSAYADVLECAGNGRVWVYLCAECLQGLRERRKCGWEFNMYMTTIHVDALDSTTHIPSPLMGEDKGEGDNWSGRVRAPGLLERASCFVIARHSSAEAISFLGLVEWSALGEKTHLKSKMR